MRVAVELREELLYLPLFLYCEQQGFQRERLTMGMLFHVASRSTETNLPRDVNVGATLYEWKGPGPRDWVVKS
jgi:hypothetical protein